MKLIQIFKILLTIPIFAFVVASVNAQTIEKDMRLKVALVLGLTGHASYHADAIRKGVDLAADELRKNGWNVDLKLEDDQTSATKTVSAFQYLLTNDYKYFIGPTWSFQANSVRTILETKDGLALVPAGSSDINGGPSDSIFNLCPSRSDQTPILVEWLKDHSYTGAFIITPNGDWGEVHLKVYKDALSEANVKIFGAETFDFGSDYGSIKALLLKARLKKADMLLVTGSGSDLSNIVRARNEFKIPISIIGTNDIRDAVGMGLLSYESIQDNVFAMSLPVAKDFEEKYRSKFKEAPKLYSERGYDALMILAEAIKSTDGNVKDVRAYLKNNLHFKGASGVVEFSKEGNVKNGDYFIAAATDFYGRP